MDKLKKLSFIVLAILLPLSLFSQQKMKLAVLDPVAAGEKLTDGIVISVREIVSSSFVNNADNYAIVERSLIDKVMQEAKFSNSDAVDETQATQLGKLAGADKVVLTVISRFDNRCMMSIKLIDVESATIDRQISKVVDTNSILDVTEPLTLSVLGKGDINSLPETSKENAKSLDKRNSDNAGSNIFAKGGLKNIFGKKKSKNKSQSNVKQSDNSVTTSVPEFFGTGINYQPIDIEIPLQKDDFDLSNFDKICNNASFNVIFDFSDARIVGTPLLQYREMKQTQEKKVFGPEFFNRMASEMAGFVKKLNKETNMVFSYLPEAPITLFVKIRDVDESGKENLSDYAFIDSATGEIITGIRLKSKGGHTGSWINHLGDALEKDAAPNIGKKIKLAKKNLKKKKRTDKIK